MSRDPRILSIKELQRVVAELIELNNQLVQHFSGHRDNRLTELYKEVTYFEKQLPVGETIKGFVSDWHACKTEEAALAFLNHRGLTPNEHVPPRHIGVFVTIAGNRWHVDWYEQLEGVRIDYLPA